MVVVAAVWPPPLLLLPLPYMCVNRSYRPDSDFFFVIHNICFFARSLVEFIHSLSLNILCISFESDSVYG